MPSQMQSYANIDQYIAQFPPEVQNRLEKMRQTIQEAAPGAEEAIRYGIPTFRLNGKNLAHFAGYKNHIGFYPAPSGIEAFKEDLAKYQEGKGTLQFPLDAEVPYDLVKRVVEFRQQEIAEKNT